MDAYYDLLADVITKGSTRNDRTGVGTRSLFGWQGEYEIQPNFPLLTAREISWEFAVKELLWFLRGEQNVKSLGSKLWDPWAKEDGVVGPIYGAQWRGKGSCNIDQLANAIEDLRHNPHTRRAVVSTWNPQDIDKMALPPCHVLFQFSVRENFDHLTYKTQKTLDCMMFQRSADIVVGVPYNIASYALLTTMIAHCLSMKPGRLIHSIGDAHIYSNHTEDTIEMLRRPRIPGPTLELNNPPSIIDGWSIDNFQLRNYNPHHKINLAIAV